MLVFYPSFTLIPQVTGRSVGGSSDFLLGAAATAVATILTYPLQIVQAKCTVGMALNQKVTSQTNWKTTSIFFKWKTTLFL
jgi:hypothetical protein